MEGERADSLVGPRWGGICSVARSQLPRTHDPEDKVHYPLSASPQPTPGLGAGLAHPPQRFWGARAALAAAPAAAYRPAADPAAEAPQEPPREPPAQVGRRERGCSGAARAARRGSGSGSGRRRPRGSAAGTPPPRMLTRHREHVRFLQAECFCAGLFYGFLFLVFLVGFFFFLIIFFF